MATVEKRIYDAARAREVLDNEAYQQAFEDIRTEYTQAWMNSPARDADGREKLYLMLQLTNKLEVTLKGMLLSGQQAKIQREMESEQLSRERAQDLDLYSSN